MKKEHIYWGLAIISVIGLGYLIYTKYKGKGVETVEEIGTSADTIPGVAINEELLLKKASKGNEVKQLQQLMQISADGVFGPQTETKLIQLKGVKEITLKSFKASMNINQNALAIGTVVMANVDPKTAMFNATKKADGSYYSKDYKIERKVNFGAKLGVIILINPAKNWYLIEVDNLLFFGTTMYFVKANEVKKI
jgi:hypothetical protein